MGGDSGKPQSGRFWKIQNVNKWIPVALFAALLYYLSDQPSLPVPGFFLSDKLCHFSFYAVFGFLVARAYGRRYLFVAFLGALIYGLADEFHQSFVPGRSAEAFDVVADAVGGFAGGLFFIRVKKWRLSRITE